MHKRQEKILHIILYLGISISKFQKWGIKHKNENIKNLQQCKWLRDILKSHWKREER